MTGLLYLPVVLSLVGPKFMMREHDDIIKKFRSRRPVKARSFDMMELEHQASFAKGERAAVGLTEEERQSIPVVSFMDLLSEFSVGNTDNPDQWGTKKVFGSRRVPDTIAEGAGESKKDASLVKVITKQDSPGADETYPH